ncbi:MAG: M20 family metallopeptidase [Actinomycetota bacterium]|nr:M20 family metallopeptidase [Actinomycetota bacterium]
MNEHSGEIERRVDGKRVTERLAAMVSTPSENPPGNEGEVATLVASLCEEIGLSVSMHESTPGRPSVVARWEGEKGPTVGYCSHIDVVPAGDHALWSREPFGAEIEDGVLYGRGACDAKGPVTAALEAVQVLMESGFEPRGTLELALVADEETMGFEGTGYLVDEKIVSPDVAIIGEPTSLRVVRAQRGACWLTVSTKGVAMHGSAPERGVSAIRHMAEVISHLEEKLPDVSHPVLGGPSINVGTISGGAKVNIVPASCVIEVDRRSLPGESLEDVVASVEAAVDAARERFPDLDANVDASFYAAPFEIDENSTLVRNCLESVAEATGREGELMGFRGASDARFLAEAGAEVVVWGPGDIALAHTAREHVDLAEVATCAAAYARAFARLLAPAE